VANWLIVAGWRSVTHIWPMISLASITASARYFASVDCLIEIVCRPTSASTPSENTRIEISTSISMKPACPARRRR
jgi:hypothetical protein